MRPVGHGVTLEHYAYLARMARFSGRDAEADTIERWLTGDLVAESRAYEEDLAALRRAHPDRSDFSELHSRWEILELRTRAANALIRAR